MDKKKQKLQELIQISSRVRRKVGSWIGMNWVLLTLIIISKDGNAFLFQLSTLCLSCSVNYCELTFVLSDVPFLVERFYI